MKSFKIRLWLPLLIIIFLAVLMIDYFDIPSRIGLSVGNMNMSLVSIVAGAFITLSLFIITYYLIDQWTVRKNKNKLDVANLILTETYRKCREDIDMINQPFVLQKLVDKTDFNKTFYDNGPAALYASAPFANEPIIKDLCADGVISAQQLCCYYKLKTEYKSYCNMVVIFNNSEETKIIIERKVLNALEAAENSVKGK